MEMGSDFKYAEWEWPIEVFDGIPRLLGSSKEEYMRRKEV